MSKHQIEQCSLPKPRARNIGWVAACLVCHKPYVLRWKLYNFLHPRLGGRFYWEAIKEENK